MNTAHSIEVLNDLIQINNDRILGYESALKEIAALDKDLQVLFEALIQESYSYKGELIAAVSAMGGTPAATTTLAGKLYRMWMEVKTTFTGTDRKSILDSCAFGEDAWRKAYEAALLREDTTPLDAGAHELIVQQYNNEKDSYNLVKKYRDAQAALG